MTIQLFYKQHEKITIETKKNINKITESFLCCVIIGFKSINKRQKFYIQIK